MRRPGILIYKSGNPAPLAYAVITRGQHHCEMLIPASDLDSNPTLSGILVHDLFEPLGFVESGVVTEAGRGHGGVNYFLGIKVPLFKNISRPPNLQYANYGETSPLGLFVETNDDIYHAYRQLVRIERSCGAGVRTPPLLMELSRIARRLLRPFRPSPHI